MITMDSVIGQTNLRSIGEESLPFEQTNQGGRIRQAQVERLVEQALEGRIPFRDFIIRGAECIKLSATDKALLDKRGLHPTCKGDGLRALMLRSSIEPRQRLKWNEVGRLLADNNPTPPSLHDVWRVCQALGLPKETTELLARKFVPSAAQSPIYHNGIVDLPKFRPRLVEPPTSIGLVEASPKRQPSRPKPANLCLSHSQSRKLKIRHSRDRSLIIWKLTTRTTPL